MNNYILLKQNAMKFMEIIESEALHLAFATRKRCQLNRVFDAIDIFYPDYPYMIHDSNKSVNPNTFKK